MRILQGDCLTTMPTLPAGCAQTCITSPPYFALRSYLPAGHPDKEKEIGSEPTPEAFIATMVAVFREVRRVLRDDGTLWLNLGDSYSEGTGGVTSNRRDRAPVAGVNRFRSGTDCDPKRGAAANGQPTKRTDCGQQLLMPHRVALALQADGWILRSTIIWAKRSPMPESVSGWRWVKCKTKINGCGTIEHRKQAQQQSRTASGLARMTGGVDTAPAKWLDCPGCSKCSANGGYILKRGKWRPTTGHEYVFLFLKSERYFCDGDAAAEIAAYAASGRQSKARGEFSDKGQDNGREPFRAITQTRNPRSVWLLSSEPYKAAHFAAFPPELVWKCLKAATSNIGCCSECRQCYAPVVEKERVPTRPAINNKIWKHMKTLDEHSQRSEASPNLDPQRHIAVTKVTGHGPTCSCNSGAITKCVVFDPFAGSGTTGQVAENTGREFIGCELNPEYIKLADSRIATPWTPKEERKKEPKREKRSATERLLF